MRKAFIKLSILFGFFVLLLVLSSLNFFKIWEKQTIDLRFQIRGEIKPSDNIVIIGIDDHSIEEIGNWPWKREIHIKLLDILKLERPKLVVFDILFDTSSPFDKDFAKKINSFNKVVLSSYLATYFDKRLKVNVLSLKEPVNTLKISSLGNGYSNLYIDDDNKVRRVKIYESTPSGVKYYSLPLVAYKFIKNESFSKLTLSFPSDFYINYRGGEGSFKIYSYVDILRKNFPMNTFRDKIVLVGAISPVLKDIFLHPFSGYNSKLGFPYSYMPGVEIHANVLDNLLMRDFLVPIFVPFGVIINFILVFFTGILLGKRIFLNIFIVILIIFTYFMISYRSFIDGIVLPVVAPSLGVVFAFLGNLIYLNLIPKEKLEGAVIKGRYKIIKKLGAGGMATVYLAIDKNTNKEVAIKILHPQYTEDKEVLERFYREIETCKILNHPYIVKVLDHGKEEYVYMVMEYVKGKDLKKILEEKKVIPLSMAIQIVKKVAEALAYASSKNIVHRDIKPQNIMITDDGKVKIMDFGIARVGGLSTLTQTGVFMGTPQYASPEQLEGRKVDIRSDIFSLGIVFYEMLTGVLPYSQETTISLILKRYQEDLPDVRTLNPNIPEGIAKIIEKMTARFPEFRYQTPEELIEDLERGYPLHPFEKKNITSTDTVIKRDKDNLD